MIRLYQCSHCHFPLDPETRRCMPCESRDEILERLTQRCKNMEARLAAADKLAAAVFADQHSDDVVYDLALDYRKAGEA